MSFLNTQFKKKQCWEKCNKNSLLYYAVVINFLFLLFSCFCQFDGFLPDPHLMSFSGYITSLCMFSLSPQSSHTSIRCSPAASLTSWPSILHNHGNTQIRTRSMERRRCLEFHIQARSSQPAFQIKADEMTAPVTLCVLVHEIETKAHSEHNPSSKTKMIVINFFFSF